MKFDIYIDGSCFGNPGPGGWAAVCKINGKKIAAHGWKTNATNNSMELQAAIGGLKALKRRGCEVTFYTDSAYLVTCSRHDNKWLTAENRANRELWMEYIRLVEKGKHTVTFVKVAGHSGVELNETADREAKAEATKARHIIARGGK